MFARTRLGRALVALALTSSPVACAAPRPAPVAAPVAAPPSPAIAASAVSSRRAAPPIAFPSATPAEARLDAAALAVLVERGAETHSDAVLVLRDGKLVVDERYGREAGPIETMSMTKTLVALAIGKLLDLGLLASIDEPMWRFYPEWRQGKKQQITVRHLLEQTSGLQADRSTEEIYASPDFVKLALAAELVSDPGTKFFYNNKAVNLLAGVVKIASKRRLDVFMREEIFGPMGIVDGGWTLDEAGNPHAMSGAKLAPIALAAIGQMMLDGGRFAGRSIASASWIAAMTTPSPRSAQYGLLTWVDAERSFVLDDGVFDAWKKGGLEPAFIAKLRPLKDRVFRPGEDYLGTIAATLGGERNQTLESWYDHTWRRGLPDAHALPGKPIGFHLDGYLGQYVFVIPSARLVAVRMRRFREAEGDDRRFGFDDFGKRVRALVASP
jgi:CubicO group peptidase (beta-lactamase class C family)